MMRNGSNKKGEGREEQLDTNNVTLAQSKEEKSKKHIPAYTL